MITQGAPETGWSGHVMTSHHVTTRQQQATVVREGEDHAGRSKNGSEKIQQPQTGRMITQGALETGWSGHVMT